jgi:hypothetical protein
MITNWLSCTNCLFSRVTNMEIAGEIFKNYYCLNKDKQVYSDDYCKEWTCKNCWNSWDNWEYDEEDKDSFARTDHSKCKEVAFK